MVEEALDSCSLPEEEVVGHCLSAHSPTIPCALQEVEEQIEMMKQEVAAPVVVRHLISLLVAEDLPLLAVERWLDVLAPSLLRR